ncbi:hypothetical protein FY034_12865 [Trichlorobacter lovleyi]|uniref:hypothetical protein n=1 Tax=Trichlorobacter lovleyi TaxID=313985 RepID=UPI00223F6115|nr:hypothetical protein [Trichlorobacter lovleyi]QOX79784.1 hypothetical protein FY034_12865 [Trichlorobacter lovleyi]
MKTKELVDTANDCSAVLAFLSHSFSTTRPKDTSAPMSNWAEVGLSLILDQLSVKLSDASHDAESEMTGSSCVVAFKGKGC